MGFQGMIEDVAVADVMQLIRLGGHSGTLSVNNGSEEGFVGFERGRIVSAWNPRSRRVGELLVSAGAIDDGTLAFALQSQTAERPRRSIGQILVRMGAITSEKICEVMGAEIERVLGEILAWRSGSFDFVVDDLTPMFEVSRFTGAPKVDLDTHDLLMDVLQKMDQAGPRAKAEQGGGAGQASGHAGGDTGSDASSDTGRTVSCDAEDVDTLSFESDGAVVGQEVHPGDQGISVTGELPLLEATLEPASERPRFQIVSPDNELIGQLSELLAVSQDRVSAVSLRDAGASLLGESPPIVVIDLRYQDHGLTILSALCRSRPRASVIALFAGRAPMREMYESGVLSVTSAAPDTVVACMRSAARQRRYMAHDHAVTEGIRVSFARLRRILVDLRSGLLGTSVSSNLMSAVAESLDRGVLFVPHLGRLVALGAFGNTADGVPLTRRTQGLVMPIGTDGVFNACVTDSCPRRMPYDAAGLPQAFLEAVDRPRTGEIAVLPVPGSERVIAAIYLDNGNRDRAIGDIEIFELAAFQLGLALENELLRRANAKASPTGATPEMLKTGS